MLKAAIRNYLVRRRDEMYEKEELEKKNVYSSWYREHKKDLDRQLSETDHTDGDMLSSEVVRYSHLRSYILSGKQMPDIIIACDDNGTLTDYAETLIRDFFAANKGIGMVYGDEDRVGSQGILKDPWLKADWSPDTFLSTFYFGSVFAIRSSELALINPGLRKAEDIEARAKLAFDSREEADASKNDLDDTMKSWIYGKLCLKLAQAEGGFSRRHKNRFPIGHIPEILFHASRKPRAWDSDLIRDSLTGRFSSASAATRLISIIIPSKDNPEILGKCIHSIEKYTGNAPYEIIVVDNGSNEQNRAKVEKLLEAHNENGSARYIYKPMMFNFSKMCNMGAEEANGELLLFLNDDVEIARPGWMDYLSEKAKLPYVGAVGMKLLYPNSDMIQHAGVVNVHAGPIHKLQYCSNREEHYFGYNKGVRNVIAVTGACLMVRTELYFDAGCMDEDNFAVAFNDVDLCLKIFEKGYYNVVRNNMYLYHHESLSRGDDRKDLVKSKRLSIEQEHLLKLHPDLFVRDPFYHQYLVQDPAVTKFEIESDEVRLRNPFYTEVQQLTRPLPAKWEDPVLKLGVEFANSLDRWLCGPYAEDPVEAGKGYYLKGYSFVVGADNAVYDRFLLLKPLSGEGSIWKTEVENVYRADIAENLTDQIHDKLTGFRTVIRPDALPKGKYLVGMLAVDRTSRQRLVNWSDVELNIHG